MADRLRDHGVRIGDLEPGARNAVTDVPGVSVGHVTVWRDEPTVARTGVTAVVPSSLPARAGTAVLNGAGELTGFVQISELGVLETPVYLTSTMAVGRIFDGAVSAAIAANPAVGVDDVVIPTVGECDDSWLSDARVVQVEAEDAGRAVAKASAEVEEGAVGAGTGMVCFGQKGGIGTSSRVVPELGTVGVLVLANFGAARELRVDGIPVGRLLALTDPQPEPGGSCIAVIATDAPLGKAQLERVARRAGLGLARTGSTGHHGSGEIFLAFSTASGDVPDSALDPIFQATVDATEEAVLNALWAATDVTGRGGRTVAALPHEPVLELLAQRGR